MKTIYVPKNGNYNNNVDRTNAHGDGASPCVICGRAIQDEKVIGWLHDIGGGCGRYLHPDSEAEYEPDGADMGRYPIGPECLRQYPQLKEYVTLRERVQSEN